MMGPSIALGHRGRGGKVESVFVDVHGASYAAIMPKISRGTLVKRGVGAPRRVTTGRDSSERKGRETIQRVAQQAPER
jgi:hypothetical protein